VHEISIKSHAKIGHQWHIFVTYGYHYGSQIEPYKYQIRLKCFS